MQDTSQGPVPRQVFIVLRPDMDLNRLQELRSIEAFETSKAAQSAMEARGVKLINLDHDVDDWDDEEGIHLLVPVTVMG